MYLTIKVFQEKSNLFLLFIVIFNIHNLNKLYSVQLIDVYLSKILTEILMLFFSFIQKKGMLHHTEWTKSFYCGF